jgi:hypothetical protein
MNTDIYQRWLDRIENLLQVQRDRCLDLISANFTHRELIELKLMIETLEELTQAKSEGIE